MTKPLILALCALEKELMDQLEAHCDIVKLYKEPDPEATLNAVKENVRGMIATMRNPVRDTLIQACPNLEIISLASVGYDNVDISCAKDNGIIVTNTPDVVTNDTADTAMGLLLNVARRYVEGDAFVRTGQWEAGSRKPIGVTLEGKILGIFGLGRIGKNIAKKAEAFGMKIAYCGRTDQNLAYEYFRDLKDMAAQVDFLLLACPGGEATKHAVNADIFNVMKPHSYLINVARGSVVDEESLLMALQNGAIAGAALDVFENEPHVPNELKTMDNVVLFPHVGAATQETFYKIDKLVVENLLAHFQGKKVLTPIT